MSRRTPPRAVALGLAAILTAGTALLSAPTADAAPVPVAPVPIGQVTTPAASTEARSTPDTKRVPAAVVPKIRWRSCGGGALAPFQCARVRVPTDYDRPYGATTTIALTRLPAAKPATKIGTLFTNPGGPGGSGVDFVQQFALLAYPQAVRDRFDILGFDPRGVSRSDPATCYPTAAAEEAALADFPEFPLDFSEVPAYDRANRALARSCATTSPDRFRHFSTANVARDMDLLRRAVGDRKLSYSGLSYGTFLGATYAALFPHRIRAMVLDGTLDPREYTGRADRYRFVPVGNRVEQDRGGAETFAEFLRQCSAAGPQRCSLAATGNPAAYARATLDALKTTPRVLTLPDGTTITVTYQTAVALIFSNLYDPTAWSVIADVIVLLGQPQAARTTVVRAVAADVAALIRRQEDYPSFGDALSTCVDTRSTAPIVYPFYAEYADARFPDFGRYRTWIDLTCSYLKQAGIRDRDAYRGSWRQTTSARVLVIGTRHDPATPYKNTRPYANLFRRASVITVEGWGHTSLLAQSRCAQAQAAAYVLDPKRPRSDSTCTDAFVPFTPTTATQRQRAAATALVLTR